MTDYESVSTPFVLLVCVIIALRILVVLQMDYPEPSRNLFKHVFNITMKKYMATIASNYIE